jgi:transcriptional regulator NrdR family protein
MPNFPPKKALEKKPIDKLQEQLQLIQKRLTQAYSMGMSSQVIAQLQLAQERALEEITYLTEIERSKKGKDDKDDGLIV